MEPLLLARSLRRHCLGVAAAELGDAEAEAVGDALGAVGEEGGDLFGAVLFGGLAEELQPAGEVSVGEFGDGEVFWHRAAHVAAGAQQHGTPEIGDGGDVVRPLRLGDDPVEHRADDLVGAGPGVKILHHGSDHRFIEFGGDEAAGGVEAWAGGRGHFGAFGDGLS